VINVQLQN